ncbi:hypothetical protein [Paludibaculum fermentans]|uniref:hypothetical protein n=1 Tax=Paludibaculum fermentans TaxID=1473598 RepID=UPI003EBC570B
MKFAAIAVAFSLSLGCAQTMKTPPLPPKPPLTVEKLDASPWPGGLNVVQWTAPGRWEYAMMLAEAGKPTQIFPPRAVEPIAGGLLVEELNRAGMVGWEVVGTSTLKPGQLTILLKRPLVVATP